MTPEIMVADETASTSGIGKKRRYLCFEFTLGQRRFDPVMGGDGFWGRL
jgi:hypothetical protein